VQLGAVSSRGTVRVLHHQVVAAQQLLMMALSLTSSLVAALNSANTASCGGWQWILDTVLSDDSVNGAATSAVAACRLALHSCS
jgi:hypothetical protein